MTALTIRLPDSVHLKIKELAARDGVSVNQFIASLRYAFRRRSGAQTPFFRQEKAPLTPFKGRNTGVFLSQSKRYLGPTPADPACTEETAARRSPRSAAPHYTVIKTLAPIGQRYGRRGAGTSEGDPLEAR